MTPLTLDPKSRPDLHPAKAFHDDELNFALKDALSYGRVATAPQVMDMKMANTPAYQRYKGSRDFEHYVTATEEYVTEDERGRGLYIVVHGAGILLKVDNILPSRRGGFVPSNHSIGQIDTSNAPIDKDKINALLKASNPELPVYSYDDFIDGNVDIEQGIVVLKHDQVKRLWDSTSTMDELVRNPLFIARCGGVNRAENYTSWFAQYQTDQGTMNNHHPTYVAPSISQGWLLEVGSANGIGLRRADFLDEARFVAYKQEQDRK